MIFGLIIEGIIKRFSGPGGFRLIIQPLVAIALGIRDGLGDANANKPAYLIGIIFHPAHRRELLAKTIENILKPFIVGVIIDLILQYFIFQRIWFTGAVIAGIILIGLPYSAARGFTNRIVTAYRSRRR